MSGALQPIHVCMTAPCPNASARKRQADSTHWPNNQLMNQHDGFLLARLYNHNRTTYFTAGCKAYCLSEEEPHMQHLANASHALQTTNRCSCDK